MWEKKQISKKISTVLKRKRSKRKNAKSNKGKKIQRKYAESDKGKKRKQTYAVSEKGKKSAKKENKHMQRAKKNFQPGKKLEIMENLIGSTRHVGTFLK